MVPSDRPGSDSSRRMMEDWTRTRHGSCVLCGVASSPLKPTAGTNGHAPDRVVVAHVRATTASFSLLFKLLLFFLRERELSCTAHSPNHLELGP